MLAQTKLDHMCTVRLVLPDPRNENVKYLRKKEKERHCMTRILFCNMLMIVRMNGVWWKRVERQKSFAANGISDFFYY